MYVIFLFSCKSSVWTENLFLIQLDCILILGSAYSKIFDTVYYCPLVGYIVACILPYNNDEQSGIKVVLDIMVMCISKYWTNMIIEFLIKHYDICIFGTFGFIFICRLAVEP